MTRVDEVTRTRRSLPRVAAVYAGAIVLVVVLAAVHLTQGTADVGIADLLRLLIGSSDDNTVAVVIESRLPRLLAGVVTGIALGVAGATLQSVARNPLASPDTLAVNAGAYLAIVAGAVTGLAVPFYLAGGLAFVGGLAAAGLVLLLSRAGAAGPTRLVLAGSATMLALMAVTTTLLVLFPEATTGLFAWGSGSIVQSGTDVVLQAVPMLLAGVAGILLVANRLDVLALGDDTASVLGLDVRRTRVVAIVLAVLLSATAVTVAGPIGFVGLCAPFLARLIARRVPGLHRHGVLFPMAGLAGVIVVLGADVLLRLALPGQYGVSVPTGVVTTLVGAVILVWIARRLRDSGPATVSARRAGTPARSSRRTAVVISSLTVSLVTATVLATLLGDRVLLVGDVVNWLTDQAGRQVTFTLNQRIPRVLAALLAGAALALAGTVIQAVCRNPLAEPSLIGVTSGAGLGAVSVLLLVPGTGIWPMSAAAAACALAVFALVYRLAHRGGLDSDRLVLIGYGVSFGATALTTLVIVVNEPWNTNLALTWLSGSTYGRSLEQLLPVTLALAVVIPLSAAARHELDLLAVDDDVPRILGVPVERARLVMLAAAALLTAAAVCAVGVISFVGLVAPHAARALVGTRHVRVLPTAMLLGALLVSVADTMGRTVIAPAQIPAGLMTAIVGAPYFLWLLWQSRGREA